MNIRVKPTPSSNIYELKKANSISEKIIRKAKQKNAVDKEGNIKQEYVVLWDNKGEKVADVIRIDDKNYIKMITKYVEEEFIKMMEHIDLINNTLLSNPSELSYKVDAIVYEKLMTFYKILLNMDNNIEYFLEEKHGDRFIEEVRHIVSEKNYRILKNNLPNKNLKETLIINHNYFAELLKFKVDEVVAKIKLSSSEEIVNDNKICILQLAIFKGLINETINEVMGKIDKFTSKEEMINAINPILEEWGYELLE